MKNNHELIPMSINKCLSTSVEDLNDELERIHAESRLKEIEKLKEKQADNGIITFNTEE